MNERRPLISAENQQTVLAVSFVIALLALVLNFYNHARVNRVIEATTRMNNINVEQIEGNLTAAGSRLTALETKLADVDGRMSKINTAPPATPAAVVAPGQ